MITGHDRERMHEIELKMATGRAKAKLTEFEYFALVLNFVREAFNGGN